MNQVEQAVALWVTASFFLPCALALALYSASRNQTIRARRKA